MKKSGYLLIAVLVISVLILSSVIYIMVTDKTPVDDPVNEADKIKVSANLYFSKDGFSLLPETREISVTNEEDKYKAVIEELIKGPSSKDFSATVHNKTKVNYVTVSDNTATIDFTDSFIKYNTGGSTREYLCIHSITASLFEFKEIYKIYFTVNGEPITTFGQFDMTDPFYNN